MGERAKLLSQLKELEHIKLDGLRFRLIDARGMVRSHAFTALLSCPRVPQSMSPLACCFKHGRQVVGRLAIEIVKLLQGKDKPTYNPKHNMGDVVIVVNAAHVHFTRDQWATKLYRWHTGVFAMGC